MWHVYIAYWDTQNNAITFREPSAQSIIASIYRLKFYGYSEVDLYIKIQLLSQVISLWKPPVDRILAKFL